MIVPSLFNVSAIKSIFVITLVSLLVVSCSKSEVEMEPVVSNQALNIYAPATTDYTVSPPSEAGNFTKFNFETGSVVTNDNWDVAFRGTTIIVNGGVEVGLTDEPSRTGIGALSLQTGAFSDILMAPEANEFTQDQAGALALPKSTWYTYNRQTHIISAVAGKVLVIKTHNDHYVKMEILSYYKDLDTSQDPRYYSFNYVFNPNIGEKILE